MKYDENHLNQVLRYGRKYSDRFEYDESLEQLDDDDACRIIEALTLLDKQEAEEKERLIDAKQRNR